MKSGFAVWNRRDFLALSSASFCLPKSYQSVFAAPGADVITIGGAITEIAYALEQGSRLVARDTTSTYPAAAEKLPDVGYMRQLSAEGVLSFAPSLIISQEGAGPPEVIDILQEARVPFVEVPNGYDRTGVVNKIHTVGAAFDVPGKALTLAEKIDAELQAVETKAARAETDRKRVMFILSTQGGRIMASGTGTGADGIVRLAGADNAVSSFEGYKPLSDEAVTASAPDVILMMDRSGDHAVSDADLFEMPALSATPAANSRSVVRMNGLYLLGFGPRTAQAATDLNRALYPDT
ncbi:MAG: ABC transporter substrate-binding protein [Pseudomonadota bacterium]